MLLLSHCVTLKIAGNQTHIGVEELCVSSLTLCSQWAALSGDPTTYRSFWHTDYKG